MGALKGWHIVLLVVVALLLFGWKRMPDMARALGRSMRILKAETKTLTEEDVEAKADAKHTRQPLPPTIEGEVDPSSADDPSPAEKQRER